MTTTQQTANLEVLPSDVKMEREGVLLPMEIIEQIALHLADHGTKSAVKAALIHPVISKNCLNRMYDNGITAHITKPTTLDILVRQLSAREVPIRIETLRFHPASFCSLRQEDNVRRVLNHLLEVDYHIEDLQLFLPFYKPLFDAAYSNKVLLSSVRSLTMLHGPYPLQHVGVAYNVEEVTLVEPAWFAVWALRLLPRLEVVYLFFIEDDEPEGEDWWYLPLRRYAMCCRRGVIDKLNLIKSLQVERIYFIVMDGDPNPTCTLHYIGQKRIDQSQHIFYRFYSTEDQKWVVQGDEDYCTADQLMLSPSAASFNV